MQLNCTYSNYTQAASTCSAAQQHSTFTVQILYRLYSVQLNCTYSHYTETAAIFSAAQQHSTFTVQYCTNCTVSNWTVLTVITQNLPLYFQLHNSTQTVRHVSSQVRYSVLFINIRVSVCKHSVMPSNLTIQIHRLPKSTVSPVHSITKRTQLFVCLGLHVYTDREI